VTIHAVTAIESALLDLLGQHLDLPLPPCWAKEFSVMPSRHSVISSTSATGARPIWPMRWRRGRQRLVSTAPRDRPHPRGDRLLAEATHDRYGFADFKLKGGVLRGEQEIEAVTALAGRFPKARVTLDPNGAWSLEEAVRLCKDMYGILAMPRIPAAPKAAFPVARSWRSSAADRPADRDQHDRHRLASTVARAAAWRGRHSPRRPAFLDHAGLGARGTDLSG